MRLSDAGRLGLTVGRFAPPANALGGAGTDIHYVGTCGWENQSSGCVLLHGGSGDWRHYAANLQRLSREMAVLAPDLPGFGASGDAEGDDLDAVAGPIAELLQASPWRDVTLVGFSFGALVAATVAMVCPPTRLLLVSPAGFGAHSPEMAAVRDQAARTARERGVRAGLAINLNQCMLRHPHPAGEALLLDQMEDMLRATRAKVRRFSRSELILDRLRQLDCPVRVQFGEFDPYHASALSQRCTEIAAACPGARIEIVPDAAHWVMLERAEVFETAVLEFCREVHHRSGR